MAKYPPYVNAYGKIPEVFSLIKSAAVPKKFTQDFLSTVLGLKSSSYRAMIPFLKKLGFLDQGNGPTQRYRDYRDDNKSGIVLAEATKEAYQKIYQASEYAHKLGKKELNNKWKTVLGVGKDDKVIPYVVGTFNELVNMANFEAENYEIINPVSNIEPKEIESEQKKTDYPYSPGIKRVEKTFGISYTINLNLPPTTDIQVFNAIFKSLKEHILDE